MIWKIVPIGKNLRIIGLPESFNARSLPEICATHIPEALGIAASCVVERAHCLRTPSNDHRSPHPVIVHFLNYTDRVAILRSFRNAKCLQVNSHKLLLFADYSQEVSRRCKDFQPICVALFQKGMKFTLAYPAILRFTDSAGKSKCFSQLEEATNYLQSYLHIPLARHSENVSPRPLGPRDPRSSRKDPSKDPAMPTTRAITNPADKSFGRTISDGDMPT